MRGLPRLIPALLVALALAGCTGASLSPSNFSLTPDRIGWNVGEEAVFTLTLKSTVTEKEPSYTLDPDFAIAEISIKRDGIGIGGYSTKNSADVGLRLTRDGSGLDDAALDATNSTVQLHLVLPNSLKDAEYVLELRLFEVGWVKSGAFRVNVP